MLIATELPDAQWNGERVIVTVPSGRDTIEIAMDVHQIAGLVVRAVEAREAGFVAQRRASVQAIEEGQIIAFRRSVA